MNENIIELTTDAGFSKMASMYNEGDLELLQDGVDLDLLLEKQAYADGNSFADVDNKRFSIASPVETYISAKYAEKCANDLADDVLTRINDACDVFNIPVSVCKQTVVKVAQDQFSIESEALEEAEKYAGCTTYGSELDICLAARAINAPDYAEDFEKLASMRDELEPDVMVRAIQGLDEEAGLALPWVQCKVGTPEHAVYEKRASYMTVDLGNKAVAIEKLAEMQDYISDMGVDVNFDEEDPYTIKLALERLPKQVKKAIADIC